MAWELWRADSLSRSGAFKSRNEALDAIRKEVARSGRDLVERFTLVHAATPTQRKLVAKGPALVEMALGDQVPPAKASDQRRRALAS